MDHEIAPGFVCPWKFLILISAVLLPKWMNKTLSQLPCCPLLTCSFHSEIGDMLPLPAGASTNTGFFLALGMGCAKQTRVMALPPASSGSMLSSFMQIWGPVPTRRAAGLFQAPPGECGSPDLCVG
uniref:Uncharacterized protein n=1 Tax=Crocodylus porosus TaxID=8502 RepID=A0A7M4E051_CROPO